MTGGANGSLSHVFRDDDRLRSIGSPRVLVLVTAFGARGVVTNRPWGWLQAESDVEFVGPNAGKAAHRWAERAFARLAEDAAKQDRLRGVSR